MRSPLHALASVVALVEPDGMVLLDGSDRWRSLLLGAPPLLS
jgi:hypothetical protein